MEPIEKKPTNCENNLPHKRKSACPNSKNSLMRDWRYVNRSFSADEMDKLYEICEKCDSFKAHEEAK